MTLEEIKSLSNKELVELYADLVRVDHYDPCETPKFAKALWNEGISQYVLRNLIVERMSGDYA